jgi:hypothetical protein
MQWLALLLLIPAIVVPVVLLFGFAGCDLVFGLHEIEPPELEPGFTAALTNNSGQANQTIVQRIEPPRLFKSGGEVQITVRSSDNSDLVIQKLLISKVAPGGDPYDSAGDLTEVVTAPIVVPQNTSMPLEKITYALDHTQPLLVIFDIGMPGGTRFETNVNPAEGIAFVGPDGEAALMDRQSPPAYQSFSRIFIVEKIDVA